MLSKYYISIKQGKFIVPINPGCNFNGLNFAFSLFYWTVSVLKLLWALLTIKIVFLGSFCCSVLLCYLCCCSWVLAKSLLSLPSIPSISPFSPPPPSCRLPLPHPLNATKRLHVMLSALLALWPVLNNVGLLLAPLLPPHLPPLPLLLLRPQLEHHIIIYHQI